LTLYMGDGSAIKQNGGDPDRTAPLLFLRN
jgi:hypothetical protein